MTVGRAGLVLLVDGSRGGEGVAGGHGPGGGRVRVGSEGELVVDGAVGAWNDSPEAPYHLRCEDGKWYITTNQPGIAYCMQALAE